ncbi:D-TA family PLP-dependent enzyme [Tabrizicola oligotrophica]|uniref:D-TA family PLP-dependent enzyme n=1 Tax=Tabrizicola oligotrophica TaxID=2710650 RepID=A0A6M0QT46_9RHOB|nr:D-TA family PLP-dependent enzyme [Tabrizicola oligotrophica]NEY90639.1 D-TA family PLP-dependent enzyme [Tabrizicola oligotrophica]
MSAPLDSIETPAFVVDEAIALRNIRAFQDHCDKVGLKLRPHIKTHKLIRFAKAQIRAGANGITCQKIGEAEVMADGGLDDILITYNIVGPLKLARLRALAGRVSALAVTADSEAVVAGLSQAFALAARPLRVLVECDTGGKRCGVQTPAEALALALRISTAPGLRFGGLMTYPAAGLAGTATAFLTAAREALVRAGLDCPEVTSGGSPDMWTSNTGRVLTEYRAGTYIYNDRSLVQRGVCTWDDCAGQVLATVVSTPAPDRAVIDAGSKVLSSDLLGLADHGHVLGHPELRITALSEEHGVLAVDPARPLAIGQRLRIVPNHVCVVSNLFDRIWLATEDGGLEQVAVDARGRVT